MDTRKEQILLVDDSKLSLTMLKKILKDKYIIHSASDGMTALSIARQVLPDLILLDVILPDIDGFEVIKQLKGANETNNIPVIFITSLADSHDEEKGLLLGAVDYIKKPFNHAIVSARVNTHIVISRQRKIIENYALLDSLTEIPNRRNFDNFIEQEWMTCLKTSRMFTLFYLDIDYFKQYNDNYGHAQGDVALKSISRCMRNILKEKGDYVARIGGEEFGIILIGMQVSQIESYIDYIRASIEDMKIEHQYSEVAPILTVSIGGVTLMPSQSDSLLSIQKQVDDNLYKAKKNGRNNVVWENINC